MNSGFVGPISGSDGFQSYQLPSGPYATGFRQPYPRGIAAASSPALYGMSGTPFSVGSDGSGQPHPGNRGHHYGQKKHQPVKAVKVGPVIGALDTAWLEQNKFYVLGGALAAAGLIGLLVSMKK